MPADLPTIKADFPPKLDILFKPKRTKVMWGGRGAGRSWSAARALIMKGAQGPLRVLCVRELQNSIADSVHRLLSEQIASLGLDSFYSIEKARIYGPNGTEFLFEGIKNNTSKIKSFEGIDICWAEEANKISKASWNVLIPTIRKQNSEIWITFNPELDSDYTYKHFVLNPSKDSFVAHMNYKDNPWFPEVLRKEMEECRERDYDAYLNVWEGHPQVILDGVIYAKQLRAAMEAGRIGKAVPYDANSLVSTYWDLGRADQTAIWFAQRSGMQIRVLHFYQNHGEDIDHYIKYCQDLEYLYDQHHLPHDAKHLRMGMQRSIEASVRNKLKTVKIMPKYSRTDGINAARMIFRNCWFDLTGTEEGVNSLKHYRYQVDEHGKLSNEPLHDEYSDGADAFRLLGIEMGGMRSPKAAKVIENLEREERKAKGLRLTDLGSAVGGALGWLR